MQNGYWKILGVVDLSQAQAEIRTLLLDTFGIFFLVACILIFLSIQMSKSISRPIKNLQTYMEKFSTGEFSVTAVSYTHLARAAAAAAKKLVEAAAKAVKELISALASLGGGTALFVMFSIVIVAGTFLACLLYTSRCV